MDSMTNARSADQKTSENATRVRFTYRNFNLYVIVTDNSISFSAENTDEFKTLAGLELIETLVNRTLENESLEEVAGLCFECSYNQNDLPRCVHDAIMWHLDRRK